jgi:2-polyprenyl-3-methyl-5-hydroxy-6-metoxy-1,4-benzoquinol methylase
MRSAQEHYETHLARHYSRCMGGFAAKTAEHEAFFEKHGLRPQQNGRAVDLGAGSGFQSLPLAKTGFTVTAVDFSPTLLDELTSRAQGQHITAVTGDILDVDRLLTEPVELAVCMGDTLSHLASSQAVALFIDKVRRVLADDGLLVLSFRDQATALVGTDRFLPVFSDETLVFTCFLEYSEDAISVTDLFHVRTEAGWVLEKSAYRKARLRREDVLAILRRTGFRIEHEELARGLVSIIARKA